MGQDRYLNRYLTKENIQIISNIRNEPNTLKGPNSKYQVYFYAACTTHNAGKMLNTNSS